MHTTSTEYRPAKALSGAKSTPGALSHGRSHCDIQLGGKAADPAALLTEADVSRKWDVTVGGSALCGETSRQAMRRELREELGLDIDLSDIRPRLTVNFEDGFDDYYIIARDISLSQLHLQPEEVMDARWATLEEVCAMIDSGEFIPFMKSFIAFLFEMRNGVDNLNT